MKTILIVDDRPYIRAALRGHLTLHSEFEICGEAADGIQAITQARKYHPDFILMDVAMPNMNGAEAALVIKNLLPDVRIVMFTLFADLAGTAMAKVAGVDLVLPKADGATGLIDALKGLLTELPQQSDKKSAHP